MEKFPVLREIPIVKIKHPYPRDVLPKIYPPLFRKLLWGIAIIALLLLGGNLFLIYKLNDFLKNPPAPITHLEYDDIDISILGGNVSMSNVNFRTNDSIALKKRLGSLSGTMKEIGMSGFDYIDLYRTGALRIDEVFLEGADLVFHERDTATARDGGKGDLFRRTIELDEIALDDVSIKYYELGADTVTYLVDHLHFEITEVGKTDSTGFTYNLPEFSTERVYYNPVSKNASYTVSSISFADDEFEVTGIDVVSADSVRFGKRIGKLEAEFEALTIEGRDWRELWREQSFDITDFELRDGSIHFAEKQVLDEIPPKPPRKKKKRPFTGRMENIALKNIDLDYDRAGTENGNMYSVEDLDLRDGAFSISATNGFQYELPSITTGEIVVLPNGVANMVVSRTEIDSTQMSLHGLKILGGEFITRGELVGELELFKLVDPNFRRLIDMNALDLNGVVARNGSFSFYENKAPQPGGGEIEFPFNIDLIDLENIDFAYYDERGAPSIVSAENIFFRVTNLAKPEQKWSFDLPTARARNLEYDPSGEEKYTITRLNLTPAALSLYGTDLHTGNSISKGTVRGRMDEFTVHRADWLGLLKSGKIHVDSITTNQGQLTFQASDESVQGFTGPERTIRRRVFVGGFSMNDYQLNYFEPNADRPLLTVADVDLRVPPVMQNEEGWDFSPPTLNTGPLVYQPGDEVDYRAATLVRTTESTMLKNVTVETGRSIARGRLQGAIRAVGVRNFIWDKFIQEGDLDLEEFVLREADLTFRENPDFRKKTTASGSRSGGLSFDRSLEVCGISVEDSNLRYYAPDDQEPRYQALNLSIHGGEFSYRDSTMNYTLPTLYADSVWYNPPGPERYFTDKLSGSDNHLLITNAEINTGYAIERGILTGEFERLDFDAIDWSEVIEKKHLNARYMVFRNADFTFTETPNFIPNDTLSTARTPEAKSPRYDPRIDVDMLEVTNVNARYYQLGNNRPRFAVQDFTLQLPNIRKLPSKPATVGDPVFTTGPIVVNSRQGALNEYRIDGIVARGDFLTLGTVEIVNAIPLERLSSLLDLRTTVFTGTFPAVRFQGMDLRALFARGDFIADRLDIAGPDVHLYLPLGLPKNLNVFLLFPHEAIYDLDQKIDIDHVRVEGGNFDLDIDAPLREQSGTLFFSDIDVRVSNVNNFKNASEKGGIIDAQVDCRIMDRGKVRAEFYLRPGELQSPFSFTTTLDSFDLVEINPLMEYSLGISIKKGAIHQLDFQAEATQDTLRGTVKMFYDDLDIIILGEEGDKKGFLSFIADKLALRDASRPGKEDFISSVVWPVERNRSFFGNYWHFLADGLVDAMVKGVVDGMLRKQVHLTKNGVYVIEE